MSELNAYKGDVTIPIYGTIADAEVYLKKDADTAIAELKQKLESVQASMYADVVDANMDNRKLNVRYGLRGLKGLMPKQSIITKRLDATKNIKNIQSQSALMQMRISVKM